MVMKDYTYSDQLKDEGLMIRRIKRAATKADDKKLYALAQRFTVANDIERTRLWLQYPVFKEHMK